jgi:ankyrin repeat protein
MWMRTPILAGNTALHKAAASGYTEIIRPLLAHHADTTLKNLEGETAVKLAIKNKHDHAVKVLLTAHHH